MFLPLSAVCSSSNLASLFHLAATSEIRSSRVFPTMKPTRFVILLCPLDLSEVRLLRSCPHSANFLHPAYKALLLMAIRSAIDGFSIDTTRSLLELSAPPGFNPNALKVLPHFLRSCPWLQGLTVPPFAELQRISAFGPTFCPQTVHLLELSCLLLQPPKRLSKDRKSVV